MDMATILVIWPRPFEQTFVPRSHGDYIWNLASIGLAVSKENKFENVVNLSDIGPRSMNDLDLWLGQWMTLTFDIHVGSYTHLVLKLHLPSLTS